MTQTGEAANATVHGVAVAIGGAGVLLRGRSARLVVTMDWPVWAHHLMQGAPGRKAMARATLGFCGVNPVRVTELGAVGQADEAQRERFFARVRADARKDVRALPKVPEMINDHVLTPAQRRSGG